MQVKVRLATPGEAGIVAQMAVALTEEISATLGARHFNLDVHGTAALCRSLLEEGRYLALLAEIDEAFVGFAGLSEGRALYAGGALATIQEFYVQPAFRSQHVGASLLQAAARLAHERGWHRLEVCTPPLPEFERSLAFYQRNGFEITGGRKLKLVVA